MAKLCTCLLTTSGMEDWQGVTPKQQPKQGTPTQDCVNSNTEIQFKLYVMSLKVCKCTGGFKMRMLKIIKK